MNKTLFCISLAFALPSVLLADNLKISDIKVEKLGTRIKSISRGKYDVISITASREIIAPKDASFSINIQWSDEKQKALVKGKKHLVKTWKQVTVPAKYRHSWKGQKNKIIFNEIDVSFTFSEFEQFNLPTNQTIRLYATCEIYSRDLGKFIGYGWSDRAAIILTTDSEGRIVKASAFSPKPFFTKEAQSRGLIEAKKMTLKTEHLKLKPGVSVYETKTFKHVTMPVLSDGKKSAILLGSNRGYFFEKIENEQQAIELSRLSRPYATVLESEEDFKAILDNLRMIKDWNEKKWFLGMPTKFGTTVKRVPEMGFEVRSVYINSFYDQPNFRDIVESTTTVAFDGRVSEQKKVLLKAPQFRSMSRPNNSPVEFGLVGFKRSGDSLSDAMDKMNAANNAYRKAIVRAINNRITVPEYVEKTSVDTNSPAPKIPAPWDWSDLLTKLEDWPEED